MVQSAELRTDITADSRKFVAETLKAKKQVQDLANTIQKDFALSAKEANSLASKYFRQTGSQIEKLRNTLGGFGTVFKDIGRGLVAGIAAGGIIETIRRTGEEIDDTIASAKKLSIGVDTFQALSYAAKQANVDVGVFEQGIKKLQLNIAKGKESDTIAGIKISELRKGDAADAYLKIAKSINGVSDSYKQAKMSFEAFGKSGQEQLNLLRGGISEYVAEFKNRKWGLSDEDVAVYERLDEATKRLTQSVKGGLQQAYIGLAKSLFAVSDAGTSAYEFLRNDASALIGRAAGEKSFNPNTAVTNLQQNRIADLASAQNMGGSLLPNYRQGSNSQSILDASGRTLEDQLAKLAGAAAGAAEGLNTLKTSALKDLFGLQGVSGQQYLSSILPKQQQLKDDTFTRVASQLQEIVATGGNVRGVPFQSGLALLKQIARDSGLYNDATHSNSGMLAAVKAIEDATKGIERGQEVRLKITVDKAGVIQTVIDSDIFAKAVVDQAVIAADNSARKAAR